MKITADGVKAAEKVLADNGIEEDEIQTVLQAVGYALADVELYPESGDPLKAGFDFGSAFMEGFVETCGAFARTGPSAARIGISERTLNVGWFVDSGKFRAYVGAPEWPDLEFGCRVEGWEEWMAVDAGRDFGKCARALLSVRGK